MSPPSCTSSVPGSSIVFVSPRLRACCRASRSGPLCSALGWRFPSSCRPRSSMRRIRGAASPFITATLEIVCSRLGASSVRPARRAGALVLLQVRVDLLVATPAPGWRQLVAGRRDRGPCVPRWAGGSLRLVGRDPLCGGSVARPRPSSPRPWRLFVHAWARALSVRPARRAGALVRPAGPRRSTCGDTRTRVAPARRRARGARFVCAVSASRSRP